MEPLPKKWVFMELVNDPNDPEQLVAYAIYKADKDDHAKQCRIVRRMTEEQITTELARFHDAIVHSERQLNGYRTKAKSIVDQLIVSVSERATLSCDQLLASHQQQHQKELAELWLKWGERAANYSDHLIKRHWFKNLLIRVARWIGGGLSSLLATAFSTLLIVGTLSLFKPDVRDLAREALKGIVGTLIPQKPGFPAIVKPDAMPN
ncbi:hypothetical protein [Pantoea sp. B65]|uniref:hypothetical protein n=1 Tax=Pantoea sp. B65 TaxID=2813359 RepID=UPI0039B4D6B6